MGTGARASGISTCEQIAQDQATGWAWCSLGEGKASWHPFRPSLLLFSVLPLPAPQVDEAQRRMDAEIWQLLSSFAARPHPPPRRLPPHPQPAAALRAAPPLSPSSSSSSVPLSSSAGSQVCAKAPTKGPLPTTFSRHELFLNQLYRLCHFCILPGLLFTSYFPLNESYANSVLLLTRFLRFLLKCS